MSDPTSQRTQSKSWLLTSASIPLERRRSCAHAGGSPGPRVSDLTTIGVPISPASILALGLGELGLEAAHEADLEHDPGPLGRRRHGVAVGQGQRHGLLAEDVLAGAGGEHGQLGMGEGGGGDHHAVESRPGERLLEVGEDVHAQFGARLVAHHGVGVHDAGQLGPGDRPGGVAGMHHARPAGARARLGGSGSSYVYLLMGPVLRGAGTSRSTVAR